MTSFQMKLEQQKYLTKTVCVFFMCSYYSALFKEKILDELYYITQASRQGSVLVTSIVSFNTDLYIKHINGISIILFRSTVDVHKVHAILHLAYMQYKEVITQIYLLSLQLTK